MGIITKRMKLEGSQGERDADAMFDSGASYSFIRRDVAEQVETPVSLRHAMDFEMAERGATVTVSERVTLDFYIDGSRFSDEFLVFDGLSEEVIIGAKTMQAWHMKIDMEHEDVIVPASRKLKLM